MTARLTGALLLAASVHVAPAPAACAEAQGAPTTLPDIAFTITAAEHAAARVAAVEPQADRLPANLLRFHVHFSAPMAQGDAYRHLSLVRADGSLVPSPFLNLSWELWDREQKRLTVLLDPGRIKRGVGPHLASGPPLVEGETYTFRVGPGLRDARGQVLTEGFEKIFVAVAPEPERLDPRRWTIMAPSRGSREPLRVETAVHIDTGAFGGAIRIVTDQGETVAGAASLLPGARAWQFIPDRDWLPGRYRIEIRTEVEDISGNSVQSAFDAVAGRSASLRDEHLLLSFEIGGK